MNAGLWARAKKSAPTRKTGPGRFAFFVISPAVKSRAGLKALQNLRAARCLGQGRKRGYCSAACAGRGTASGGYDRFSRRMQKK